MQIETELRPADSRTRSEARLLADLRLRRPAAIAAVISRFARELTSVAYLTLQHHDAAADAVAQGIAACWRRVDFPDDATSLKRVRLALLGSTARHALLAHRASRAVDPTMEAASSHLVAGLSPEARAALGLRAVGGLNDGEIADELRLGPRQRRNVMASIVRRTLPASVGGGLPDLPVTVDSARVRLALAQPAAARRTPRRGPTAVLAAIGAALGVALILLAQPAARQPALGPDGPTRRPAAAVTNNGAVSLGTDSLWSRFWPGRADVPAFTLADCHIEPASEPIAFAGWVTVEEIGARGVAPPGRSVYAIVTRGEAEWIGYRYTHDRPVFPRPVGRLGCVFDPASERYVAIGVAQSWQPPTLADGCPASPISSFAGYREIGGPGAFVLVDSPTAWEADDPELSFLVRVAPPPPTGTRVEVSLRPVGDGPQVAASVRGQASDSDGSALHYLQVNDVDVPEPGCWIMNVAVDGTVVGSAVLPIVALR